MIMEQMLRSMVVIVICTIVASGVGFASATNVALNADVTLHGGQFFFWGVSPPPYPWRNGYEVSPDTIVDGVFLPRRNQWDRGPVWWVVRFGNPDCEIEIDLGNTATIESFVVQADDNDGYELYYWDLVSSSWQLAWDVPNYDAYGWGIQTRPNPANNAERYILPTPIVTNKLKFKGTLEDGDLGFAVSEIQAWGEVIPANSLSLNGDPLVVPVGGLVSFTGEFTNGDDPYGSWDFGDGSVTAPEAVTSPVDADHTYSSPEVYEVTLTVTDGQATLSDTVYVAVYDPTGGFVTGGGWIDSPAGAYRPDPLLTGKSNFGFVSKYKKGANVPTGNTEFQFKAGDLNFHSTSYDWLVVTGANYARFKGTGTINGYGEYRFMLWAGDDEPDTFRIKIWEEDEDGAETVVYDNGFDQSIMGGNIVIHTKK